MAYRKIADIIASEHEKLHHRSVCANCEWVSKPSGWKEVPLFWICHHPDNLVRNYVSGEIEFKTVPCSIKNENGKCMDFERHITPPEPKPEPESTELAVNRIPTFWERIRKMLKNWFSFDFWHKT